MIEGGLHPHPVGQAVLDLQAYLNALASDAPTPGGGSAAALVGAFGASLVAMVARITLGSRKHAALHADAVAIVEAADVLRSGFVGERLHDESAFRAVVEAQALPRSSAAEKAARTLQLQAALSVAAQTPLRVAALAADLLEVCVRAANLRNAHLMSDVECALTFGQAALDASAANVRINHRYITDATLVSEQRQRLAAISDAANAAHTQATAILAAL